MTTIRRRSLELPTNDTGMLGRECPRCRSQFAIDPERYQERGFMNLRCPYCQFISKLDNFTTGEQRRYLSSTTQNMARREAERIFEDAFDGFSRSSSGTVEFDVDVGDIDFGRVPIAYPSLSADIEQDVCEECGLSYGLEVGQDGVCPVCR